MIRILAIGNSFSEDATYFLPDILKAAGIENEIINLHIGGCSLERHWRGIENHLSEYQYQRNGRKTPRKCSVETVLAEGEFDAIITQQSSADTGWECSYEPFLDLLTGYLREKSKAKLYLHETWAYEVGSPHANFLRYHRDQQEMFEALEKAYKSQAAKNDMPLIETGKVIQQVRKLPWFSDGSHVITRDGFHMSFLYGRYTVALCWARKLTGIQVSGNTYVPEVDFMPCEPADPAIIAAIQKVVDEIIQPE